MSTTLVCATAPGKMLLLGEYAVLEGCPALSVAVNRRASVCVEQTGADEHSLQTSLLPGRRLSFSVRNDELLWSDKSTASALGVDKLLSDWPDVLGDIHAPALDIHMDTSAFYEQSGDQMLKLGLGSSAALQAACAGVFCTLSDKQLSMPGLIARHRESQGGSGSGVDIATSLHGGAIRFQRMGGNADPGVTSLALPSSFHYDAIWNGDSVSTGDMLKQFTKWTQRNADKWAMCMLTARVICDAAFRAIDDEDATALARTVKGYGEWMKALEKASKIRIYTPAHSFLDTMAASYGCSYKPSGAGGGDIGVAVAASYEELTDFQDAATAEGYHWLPVETDQKGLEAGG